MRIRTRRTTVHRTDTVIQVVACSCSYKPIARDKLPKLIDQYGDNIIAVGRMRIES
jgi:hypothetical protein